MSNENENIDEEMAKHQKIFTNNVIKYLTLDDEIKKLSDEIKDRKAERKELEGLVLNYMTDVNENVINLSSGKLRRDVSQTKSALKQEYIHNALCEYTKNSEEAIKITNEILNKRPIVERVRLKRTRTRKKKEKPTI